MRAVNTTNSLVISRGARKFSNAELRYPASRLQPVIYSLLSVTRFDSQSELFFFEKISACYIWVRVVTEFIVSRTLCNLERFPVVARVVQSFIYVVYTDPDYLYRSKNRKSTR